MKKVKRLRVKRRYSEDFKQARVKEYESGEFTVIELGKLYSISPQIIYRWIYKLSKLNKKKVVIVESKDSSTKKLKGYQQRIDELERIVGQKQLKIDYLQKLFELAESDLGFDLKKNIGSLPSDGITKQNKR